METIITQALEYIAINSHVIIIALIAATGVCCCITECIHFYSTSAVQSGEGMPDDITLSSGTWVRTGDSLSTDSASGSFTYTPSSTPNSKFGVFFTTSMLSRTGSMTVTVGELAVTTTFLSADPAYPTEQHTETSIKISGVNQFPYGVLGGIVSSIEVNEESFNVYLIGGITAPHQAPYSMRVLNPDGNVSGQFSVSFTGINKPIGTIYKLSIAFDVRQDNNGADNECPICYFNNSMVCMELDRPDTFEAYIGDAFGETPAPAGTTSTENSSSLNNQTLVFVKSRDQEFCSPDAGLNSGELYTGPEFTVYKNKSYRLPWNGGDPTNPTAVNWTVESSGVVRTYAVLTPDISLVQNINGGPHGKYPADLYLGFGANMAFSWAGRCSQVEWRDGPTTAAVFFVWDGDATWRNHLGAVIESVTGYRLCTQIKLMWQSDTNSAIYGRPCSGSYSNSITYAPFNGFPNPLIVKSRCWPTPGGWSPPESMDPSPSLKLLAPTYFSNTFNVSISF